jgi:hypothetical protein
VTVVVIPSDEKGDRLVGSLEVKAPVAGRVLVRSAQRARNLAGHSKSEPGSPEKSVLSEAGLQDSRENPRMAWTSDPTPTVDEMFPIKEFANLIAGFRQLKNWTKSKHKALSVCRTYPKANISQSTQCLVSENIVIQGNQGTNLTLRQSWMFPKHLVLALWK